MLIASIDIGTNTVLMIIAETSEDKKSFKVLENEYRIPRLGRGLTPGNPVPEENLIKFYEVLDEYKKIMDRYKCDVVLAGATMAFRIASNSKQIIDYVKSGYGIEIKVLQGEEEAALSYLGAVSEYDSEGNTAVIDIGGGSTEIIFGTGKDISFSKSYPIGVVSGWEKHGSMSFLNIKDFNEELSKVFVLPEKITRAPEIAIAVAGTPTTIACMLKGMKEFNEDLIEASILKLQDIKRQIKILAVLTPEEILKNYGEVINGREDLILSGACILLYIMQLLEISEIIVSTRGIRYGMVYRYLQNQ